MNNQDENAMPAPASAGEPKTGKPQKPPRIRDTSVGASSGWWVCDPDTGATINGNSYRVLCAKLHEHRRANNLPDNPALVEDIVHAQVCAREAEAYCSEWGTGTAPAADPHIPISQLAVNFTTEMLRFAKGGFKIVSEAEFRRRLAVCRSKTCGYRFDENANGGAGKCTKCGCTKLKHWLATSRCPVGKWQLQ
jgi:hypothetical protein